MIAFVYKFQLRLDVSYLLRAEVTAILEGVALTFFFLDSRRKDVFACPVPAFACAGDNGGSSLASTFDCLHIFSV